MTAEEGRGVRLPSDRRGEIGGRVLGGIRLAWAAVLIATPGRVIVVLGGRDLPRSRLVGRVLGVRHLLQGLGEILGWPARWRTGTAVDVAHAASAVALARRAPQWRKAASADALLASAFAILGGILGSTQRAPDASVDADRDASATK
jgi:hypothetical protein